MKTSQLRRALAAACLAAAFVIAGAVAAGAHDHTGHAGHNAGGVQAGDMPYDLHYIDMTIMHHQQGIEMARLAEGKAQNARVKAFAKKTGDDQQKDMEELQTHRQHWYADRPQMDHARMTEHMKMESGHKGMNMDPEADMAKLQSAEGRAFDRLFLDTMTMHHRMAVDMSREATRKAEHAELKTFARKTVTKQTAEIAEMNRLKAGTGGRTAAKPKRPAPKPAAHAGHTHEH